MIPYNQARFLDAVDEEGGCIAAQAWHLPGTKYAKGIQVLHKKGLLTLEGLTVCITDKGRAALAEARAQWVKDMERCAAYRAAQEAAGA